MQGVNLKLLNRRYLLFTRTLISSITRISQHNPEAAALLTDVGEISVTVNALIQVMGEHNKVNPFVPPVKKKKDKPKS